jgi:hypothetical protein
MRHQEDRGERGPSGHNDPLADVRRSRAALSDLLDNEDRLPSESAVMQSLASVIDLGPIGMEPQAGLQLLLRNELRQGLEVRLIGDGSAYDM